MMLYEILTTCSCGEVNQTWCETKTETLQIVEMLCRTDAVRLEVWRYRVPRRKGLIVQLLNYTAGEAIRPRDYGDCVLALEREGLRCDCPDCTGESDEGPSFKELN